MRRWSLLGSPEGPEMLRNARFYKGFRNFGAVFGTPVHTKKDSRVPSIGSLKVPLNSAPPLTPPGQIIKLILTFRSPTFFCVRTQRKGFKCNAHNYATFFPGGIRNCFSAPRATLPWPIIIYQRGGIPLSTTCASLRRPDDPFTSIRRVEA